VTAQFYVHRARDAATSVRRRVHALGYDTSLDERLDVEALAVAFLDCELVSLPGLSERVALDYLERTYSVDITDESPSATPLAGSLFVTQTGSHRWIFVDAAESASRQRFTVAHEIGHLVLEAEPELARGRAAGLSLFDQDVGGKASAGPLLKFGRCPADVVGPDGDSGAGSATTTRPRKPPKPLSKDELREIHANHFAAELLMPYEGVRRLIATAVGVTGARTESDVDRIVSLVAARFDVSLAAGRLRVTKDLNITGRHDGHGDLFA
jgi:hypothetical protein